ncbi:unnamed protein product, partial [Nesidiocoris tenuis]
MNHCTEFVFSNDQMRHFVVQTEIIEVRLSAGGSSPELRSVVGGSPIDCETMGTKLDCVFFVTRFNIRCIGQLQKKNQEMSVAALSGTGNWNLKSAQREKRRGLVKKKYK